MDASDLTFGGLPHRAAVEGVFVHDASVDNEDDGGLLADYPPDTVLGIRRVNGNWVFIEQNQNDA